MIKVDFIRFNCRSSSPSLNVDSVGLAANYLVLRDVYLILGQRLNHDPSALEECESTLFDKQV